MLLADFLRVSVYNARFNAAGCNRAAAEVAGSGQASAETAAALPAPSPAAAYGSAMGLERILRKPAKVAAKPGVAEGSALAQRRRAAVYRAAAQQHWAGLRVPQVFRTRVVWGQQLQPATRSVQQHRQLGKAWCGLSEAAVRARALAAVGVSSDPVDPQARQLAGAGGRRRLSLPQKALLHAMEVRWGEHCRLPPPQRRHVIA